MTIQIYLIDEGKISWCRDYQLLAYNELLKNKESILTYNKRIIKHLAHFSRCLLKNTAAPPHGLTFNIDLSQIFGGGHTPQWSILIV